MMDILKKSDPLAGYFYFTLDIQTLVATTVFCLAVQLNQ